MTEQKIELKIIKMSDVHSQEIEWLWYPFIPFGKLTIVQGDPGDGKTTMVLNIAAKLSKGEGLEEQMKIAEPMNIIYQTAEDGLADTVKPSLESAGADCERVLVIDESDKSLSMSDERLEEAIKQTGARLLILFAGICNSRLALSIVRLEIPSSFASSIISVLDTILEVSANSQSNCLACSILLPFGAIPPSTSSAVIS